MQFKFELGEADFGPILGQLSEVIMKTKEKIIVLGFGSQGRAIALNLRDSGFDVSVALRPGSKSRRTVRKERLRAVDIGSAEFENRIVIVALPDHIQKDILVGDFFEKCGKKTSLIFLHGASIHFALVKPPRSIPIMLLAPHAPGQAVRENYLNKKPFSAFVAVKQGPNKRGYQTLKKLAAAIGIPSTHLVRTTFADEAIGDIFGEQAVLCGGLARLLKFGFETLVEAGLPPRNAYLEVAYQLDLIVELVKHHGLSGMLDRISPLAKYGSAVNGPVVVSNMVKRHMKMVIGQIKSGSFMKRGLTREFKAGKMQMARVINSEFDRQALKFSDK